MGKESGEWRMENGEWRMKTTNVILMCGAWYFIHNS
jgi:hypothetical protein